MFPVVTDSAWMVDRSLSQDCLIDQVAVLIELEEMAPSASLYSFWLPASVREWKALWVFDDLDRGHEEIPVHLYHSLRVIDRGLQKNGTLNPKAQRIHPPFSHERER